MLFVVKVQSDVFQSLGKSSRDKRRQFGA